MVHHRKQMHFVGGEQFKQKSRRRGVGHFVAAMHPVINQSVQIPGVNSAGNRGGKGVVAHTEFFIGERQRVINRRYPSGSIAFVGLSAGEIEREMHVRTGFDFFFQRVAMQVDHAGNQRLAAQVNMFGTATSGRINGSDEAVFDQQ